MSQQQRHEKQRRAKETSADPPPETKWQILKEGRGTSLTISQVCEQYQISPTLFYQWERAAERGARQALQDQPRGWKKIRPSEEALLKEIQQLREVIAEIATENLQLKNRHW